MAEGQKQIYYLSGASKAAAASSPVLERLRKKGFEVLHALDPCVYARVRYTCASSDVYSMCMACTQVLYALDQIDEIALQGVGKFEEYEVIDAAKENVDLGELSEEEKGEAEAAKEELKATTEFLKTTLGQRVDKVEVSARLEQSPSALVQPQWGMSPQMQRFMKAQAAAQGADDMMMGGMASNLEINPKHKVVAKLKDLVGEGGAAAAPAASGYVGLLDDVPCTYM